jgi:predicted phage tail protein
MSLNRTILNICKRSFSRKRFVVAPLYQTQKTSDIMRQIDELKSQLEDQSHYIQIVKEELDDTNDKLNHLYITMALIEDKNNKKNK